MKTNVVEIGKVLVGGDNPIIIQSMTNTPTEDVEATVAQTIELADAGSEMVRFTVNTPEAAKAVPLIKQRLTEEGYGDVPIVGDFHYNGHLLLSRYEDCARVLDKYRINPGNVGSPEFFDQIIKIAIVNDKPVRIGVNWGSLDQGLFTKLMEKNAKKKNPSTDKEVLYEALVQSAMSSARQAEDLGMKSNKIILSVKMSEVQDVIKVNEILQERCQKKKKKYPLHIGLTEAGPGMKGAIASSAAMAILLQQGIGDTIRISLTPSPTSSRTDEVRACQLLLQTMGLRSFRPMITSCPGCGRTSSNLYQTLAEEVDAHIDENLLRWREDHPGVEDLKIAVMGCVVNGPGESKQANIGICLPGRMEKPVAQVYINQELFKTLEGDDIVEEFKKILEEYVKENY